MKQDTTHTISGTLQADSLENQGSIDQWASDSQVDQDVTSASPSETVRSISVYIPSHIKTPKGFSPGVEELVRAILKNESKVVPELFTPEELSVYLGYVPIKTLRKYIYENRVPGQIKVFGRWKFRKCEVDKRLLNGTFELEPIIKKSIRSKG